MKPNTRDSVGDAGLTSVGDLPTSLSRRIPELDGLRGIAIGMVIAWHYFLFILVLPHHHHYISVLLIPGRLAWTGVDLFFVLSGFLIGGILLDARTSSNYFRVFYCRRFFRIVPIYSVFIIGMLLTRSFVELQPHGKFSWLLRDQLPWAYYPLFVQNFSMAARSTFGSYGLGVTWSLAIEEQFYLALPLLIRFLSRRALVPVLACLTLGAPLLRVSLHAFRPDLPYATFVLMPCRADALLLGVLAAIGLRNPRFITFLRKNHQIHRVLLIALSSGLTLLPLHNTNAFTLRMLSFGLTWLSLFYVSLLLYALVQPGSRLSLCLRWRWLRWLGTIAYGTYLFHEITLGLFHGLFWSRPPQLASLSQFVASILAVVVTLVVCRLSWIYFEKPFVEIGHKLSYRIER